jgi:hypothetical protein
VLPVGAFERRLQRIARHLAFRLLKESGAQLGDPFLRAWPTDGSEARELARLIYTLMTKG